MNCLICNAETYSFFYKEYKIPPYSNILGNEKIEYVKCHKCGFTFSKSHQHFSKDKLEKLNHDFHNYIENPNNPKIGNQPPYIEQATMLNILYTHKLINLSNALDFGGGFGTLVRILKKYYNIQFPIYEPYMHQTDKEIHYVDLKNEKFEAVNCSALFEHIIHRETLEEINNCVSETGALVLHTVVCENIPNDDNWFYINPVHTAFHTNKSMNELMKQWNYKSSIYCPTAKCWILYKKTPSNIENMVAIINKLFQTQYLIFKQGFVDYWKGF